MTPDALSALHARCLTMPRPWSAAEFAAFLADPACFLVAAPPQGFALGRAVAGEAELLTICVAPEARRQGLGADLLARFAQNARDRGADSLFLEVAATNAPARALYAAHGWREVGRRKRYYRLQSGGAVDALVLSRSIDSA